MSPELTLIIVNCVLLAFAYFWAYPALERKTLKTILIRDLAISAAALTVAAGLYWGQGIRFSLVFFSTNWLVFSIVTLTLIETPLFFWFAQRYDVDLNNFD